MNAFDEQLSKVDHARQLACSQNVKLIENFKSITNAKRVNSLKKKELASIELEVDRLKSCNRDIKIALMQALIERDELLTRRTALLTLNERVFNQNENLHRETDDLLRGEEVDCICERFSMSDQMSLLKELQDTSEMVLLDNYGVGQLAG